MTTVVFADLVGSTSLFERLGDDAATAFVTQLTGIAGQVFAAHRGRVVKLLGDGLFVVFADEGDALAACVSIQKRLHGAPVLPAAGGVPAQMQIGIATGDVVEIDGDCFGDTVNSAARLADLAGAAQILTTDKVWSALLPAHRACLRSMGPMYLRGRSEASHVYRVEWQASQDADATMAGRSMFASGRPLFLELTLGSTSVRLAAKTGALSLGRAADASLSVHDPRVSRLHATLQWRSGQFVLTDASSFGTWVYMGDQSEALVLRRTECTLVGRGQICLGCERADEQAPVVTFSIGH